MTENLDNNLTIGNIKKSAAQSASVVGAIALVFSALKWLTETYTGIELLAGTVAVILAVFLGLTFSFLLIGIAKKKWGLDVSDSVKEMAEIIQELLKIKKLLDESNVDAAGQNVTTGTLNDNLSVSDTTLPVQSTEREYEIKIPEGIFIHKIDDPAGVAFNEEIKSVYIDIPSFYDGGGVQVYNEFPPDFDAREYDIFTKYGKENQGRYDRECNVIRCVGTDDIFSYEMRSELAAEEQYKYRVVAAYNRWKCRSLTGQDYEAILGDIIREGMTVEKLLKSYGLPGD